MLGRKQLTVLNVPSQETVPYKPIQKLETEDITECYTIPIKSIIQVNPEKKAYRLNELTRLLDTATVARRYNLEFFHTGKETILSSTKTGQPFIQINDETQQLTLWPRFYQLLAKHHPEALLRITAPLAWHQSRNVKVDPEIVVLWEPQYQR